jgi:EmrB/QacA subfamily drug resistance transporter
LSEEVASDKIDPKVWRVAAVVFLGPLMSQLDSTVVNFSLSRIREDLHSTISSAQWIISGYLLALALMLPLNGWLVDRLGTKRLYLICFSAFTGASLLCGMATTMDGLIWARVFQGMAGGLLAPMTQLMLARVAGRHFSRVVGYSAIPVLLAPLLGPVVAGAVLKYAGWPWLFYINLPVGVLAVTLAYFLLPNDEATTKRRPFDFLGFILISPGLVSLLYGFDHVSSQHGFLFIIAGFILVAAFVGDALKKKAAALIDLRLFKNRIFRIAVMTQFLSNGVLYGGQMLIPLYLITGCGFSATKAGFILAPMGAGMLCASPLLGFLTDKFGCRAVTVGGVLLNTLGTLPFLWMIHTGFSDVAMVFCMLARGAGQGVTGIPSLAAAYASVSKDQLGLATTAMNVVQRLGGPLATTSLALIIALTATHSASSPHEFAIPFMILIGIQLSVFISAMGLPLRVHQNPIERKI